MQTAIAEKKNQNNYKNMRISKRKKIEKSIFV